MAQKTEATHMMGMKGMKWDFFVTAVNMFFKEGYSNVSVRDIAEAIEVKSASMYYYFTNKDALLQQMYEYCEAYYREAMPNLSELLEMVSGMPVLEVLECLTDAFVFDNKGATLARKILRVVLEEKNHDERAERLTRKIFVEMPRERMQPVFERMMEYDLIESVDVERFMDLHARFMMGSACMFGSDLALADRHWRVNCRHLFGVVQIKQK